MTHHNEFDALVNDWIEIQNTPWGKLVYTLSRHNLNKHIPNRPLRILDVGGGNGTNALYYTAQGHTVTLLDISPSMLAEAKQAADAQGVAKNISYCQANSGALGSQFSAQQFDLVLCHMMIEFVASPSDLVREMCRLLAPGGLLSVISTNRFSLPYRIAFQTNNLPAAQKAIGNIEYFHPWVNRLTPQFSAQEMSEMLKAQGCTIAGQYGIRCVCDYLPNEPKFDPAYYAGLEQLELALTGEYPYNLLARLYQVIAQRA